MKLSKLNQFNNNFKNCEMKNIKTTYLENEIKVLNVLHKNNELSDSNLKRLHEYESILKFIKGIFSELEEKRCAFFAGSGMSNECDRLNMNCELCKYYKEELKFPTNEKELKEFDEMFKDYPYNLKGDEIDPNKIIEESLKEIEKHENKHCKKCGRLLNKKEIYPGYISKICDCGLI